MNRIAHDWGVRLSDRLRRLIDEGRLAEAERMAREGDGHSRNLATEFFLMSRGLGITVRVMIAQLEAMEASPPRADAAALLAAMRAALRGFREDLCRIGAVPAPAHAPGEGASVAREAQAAREVLAAVQAGFETAQTALAERALAALAAGDGAQARARLDEKEVAGYLPYHDRLVRFMADCMGLALTHLGAEGLMRFHLGTAEGQKAGFDKWDQQSAEAFTRTSAFLLKQHMGEVAVFEDDEKFVIEQSPCGSGGRLRRMGAYQGPGALPVLRQAGALTFGQPALPVYCTHCPAWNSVATLHWYGRVHWPFSDPSREDGGCVLYIPKDRDAVPADYRALMTVPAPR